jgi:hypothetical protein
LVAAMGVSLCAQLSLLDLQAATLLGVCFGPVFSIRHLCMQRCTQQTSLAALCCSA